MMPESTTVPNHEQKTKMVPEHVFSFRCDRGISCFTQCCRDVTIALTPYDVLRLRTSLGISSDEFLDNYTLIIPKANRLIPLVVLKMDDEDKRCPFVEEEGCNVYQDRPWACRMYPLDMEDDGTFRLIAESSRCRGLEEEEHWRIGDWLVDQGIVPYDEMDGLFSSITVPLQSQDLKIDNPQITKMLFMALYNIDKFKAFVFESTFLDRFEVESIRLEKIKRNDSELLKFAFDWIKFGLFGQKLFWVKETPSKNK